MKKILVVFGTRPEAIKMAPLIIACKKRKEFITLICVTGQHREMLDQVLSLFEITPDYDLDIMKPNQDLYDITSSILLGMRSILADEKPDLVLVHGDTTTSTATALAAFYQKIPVAHVEAGLRTYNKHSPWPEEVNRQLTSRIAGINFAPTILSRQNLIQENIDEDSILVTGNTVIDALQIVVAKLETDSKLQLDTKGIILSYGYDIDRLSEDRRLVLITGHRRENFGDGFLSICKAIKILSEKFPSVDFVYPLHLNPNVVKPAREILGEENNLSNVFLINPIEYLPFVYLMSKSYLLLTDSGGIQEEAPGLGKPVLVMRDTTERPEAVSAGTVKLVGTDFNNIITSVSDLLNNQVLYQKMSSSTNPYGDGKASGRIVDFIINKI